MNYLNFILLFIPQYYPIATYIYLIKPKYKITLIKNVAMNPVFAFSIILIYHTEDLP